MARRRNRRGQREVDTLSLDPHLLSDPFRIEAPFSPSRPILSPADDIRRDPFASLIDVEDNREFDPQPLNMNTDASVASVQESASPLRKGVTPTSLPRLQMAFVNPERVMVCVRRKERREVLHALRRAGRGGSRRRRRTDASNIRC